MYWKISNVIIFIKFLYLAIQHTIKLFIFPSPSESELCVTQILYIFIPKMHLEKHNTRALHHLILTAHGNSHSKIEYSLVSNIYSTPILFFSKWVWIRTRVRHFCISESTTKMDELEVSHLRLKLPCGPSYFKVAKSCSYSWMHNIILIFFMVMDHCSGWLI